jgi:phage terminase large subunit
MKADRLRMSPEDFKHIWEGDYNTKSDALIFKGKYEVDYFEPDENWTRLQGLDFGFSQDPTAGVVCYVNDNKLYIRNDFAKIGLELDDTADFILNKIPNYHRYVIRADNARPESISYLKRKGLPLIRGEAKLKIEDGIEHIKQYDKIIIHPDCKETIKEFGLYSYKADKRSGDILPAIEDKNNHCVDSLRYALYPLIKKKNELFFVNM